jgi:hypothetical protein
MATLQSYLTDVQRLLHDANLNFYTQQQLTDYINSARERVVRDTGCLRQIVVTQTPTVQGGTPTAWVANTAVTAGSYVFSNIFIYQYQTSGTSSSTAPPYPSAATNNYTNYPPSTAFADGTATLLYVGNCEIITYENLSSILATMPLSTTTGNTVLDIVNINLYWGNTRVPLDYLSWSDFNARLRFWQNYIGRPLAFSIYSQNRIYIGPVPDQIYQVEIDCVLLPNPLSLSTSTAVDSINDPYSVAVKFYAAYLAKYYEQSFGEAEIYKQEYTKQISSIINTIYTRRIPTIYSSPM